MQAAIASVAAEAAAQLERWVLWAPVALGAGAGTYFALPREPSLVLALGLLALAGLAGLAAVRWAGGRAVGVLVLLAAFGLAGFSAAKLRAWRVAAPVVLEATGPRTVSGWVVDVASPGQGGQRLLLAPVRISGMAPEATPVRVRVTLRDGQAPPDPGSAVALRAILNPPPPPASPGAYDFARDAWFESIGAVGFSLTPVRETALDSPPSRLRLTMQVNAIRWALAEKIVATMGVETGGLAAAMVTGHEAFIPREQVEAMRAAGLAHIISISGLHMAIVGGFVFFALRLGIAAWPWLALRINAKKAAAVAGLAAVAGYLVISGSPPPAERAAITAGVAFAAILFDRRAITLRGLAIAALIILAAQPEAVTTPGFQMSFAATAALVALAEAWNRPIREIETPWWIRAPQAAGVWIAASVGASFVAGLATGPFAMQHFNRVATWGLIANLLTAPISSFVMMPALAIGAALTPVGLGELPLKAAGWAIGLMTGIAERAAAAPSATLIVPSAPAWTLPAAFVGILWVCIWRGRLRWAGVPFALAVALTPKPAVPDVWIASDGAAVAVRNGREAVLLRPGAKRFAADLWARRRGLTVDETPETLFDCDRWTCRPIAADPALKVAASFSRRPIKPAERERLCAEAEVIVVRSLPQGPVCPGKVVLTGRDFARGGSVELWRRPDGWRIRWAQEMRGWRPWSWSADGAEPNG
ncbi:ComEC/Rec2 family competence protein [Phenylobacterium terrae]|uniref:ComEC/Rec2 family competence protein n=1 Tax=Phenylobacterium terrae TaxID=2665495 RepID=A0ABW4N483_9CAUL